MAILNACYCANKCITIAILYITMVMQHMYVNVKMCTTMVTQYITMVTQYITMVTQVHTCQIVNLQRLEICISVDNKFQYCIVCTHVCSMHICLKNKFSSAKFTYMMENAKIIDEHTYAFYTNSYGKKISMVQIFKQLPDFHKK